MQKTNPKTLGALIAARRRAVKLNQSQLAAAANTTQQIVSLLERGVLSDVALESYGHVVIAIDRALNTTKPNPSSHALWRELLLKELTWQLTHEPIKYTVLSSGLLTQDLRNSGCTEDDVVRLLESFAAEGLIRVIDVSTFSRATKCLWVLRWTL